MRPISLYSLLAVVALYGSPALAQQAPSPVLNEVEVRQLIERADAADHGRLAVHFSALAERASAEASRHLTMARGASRNVNRNTGASLAAHCRRLAETETRSAEALKALADHHAALAKGAPSVAPTGSESFAQGARAAVPTAAELEALAASAATAADHRGLAQYFQGQADRLTREAATHASLAKAYRAARGAAAMAPHCERLAALARTGAAEAAAAAELHAKHAGQGQ